MAYDFIFGNGRRGLHCLLVFTLTLLAGCGDTPEPPAATVPAESQDAAAAAKAAPAAVDGARIVAADKEPGNWMSHGRTYDEQRYSPLDEINANNVAELGLDWYYDFPTKRGMEATPIAVDGVLYVSASWSKVYAFDAKSGEQLWHYDPKVPGNWAVHLCCDVVNRGVAVWDGKVFVGTLDGRLLALNATDGSVAWEVQTTPKDKPYSITGAPRVVKGNVIIGNGGAELDVRGFVSAYDAATGDLAWRFYTVPGDPSKPFENPILKKAAETWTGEWWKMGGGGTAWDSMAYDPELDLLYIGVGNGAPWNRQIRSPDGGDNWFLSSIVALKPDTGEYVWHYQTTPGETWDYTATQHMILADLEVDGKPRKVIMQAPKNGFFYLLDRANGELISAEKYTKVTWAKQVDMKTGRPVETKDARYTSGGIVETFPNTQGGHNWHPMSYSPETGLVYIPAHQGVMGYSHDKAFEYQPGYWNTGVDFTVAGVPDDPEQRQKIIDVFKGFITAWDPVAQKEVWRVPHTTLWNGGMLSTAGNLLFQGNADGEFVAYSADMGKPLWTSPAYTGIVAAPITYTIDGTQYVAVVAGWGGAQVAFGEIAGRAKGSTNRSRLLVYRLGGDKQLPVPEPQPEIMPEPPPLTAANATMIKQGYDLYMKNCHVCHGDRAVSGTSIPDLRRMSAKTHEIFPAIVLGGLYHERGMVGFADVLSGEEAEAIHAYLIKRGHDLKEKMAAADQKVVKQ